MEGGIDLDGFREWLVDAGAESMLDDFLSTFRSDAPNRLQALEQAATSGDVKAIERAAHKYLSAAVTIFATTLGDLLGKVEVAASKGDLEGAAAAIGPVRTEHARVMQSLE
jgi:HPt (histidine-containing phosphotransfer) domain-containing protein